MGQETLPPLHKSASAGAAVAIVATLLDLLTAGRSHVQLVGLHGFRPFYISCSMLVLYLARPIEANRPTSVSPSKVNQPAAPPPITSRNERLPGLMRGPGFAPVREARQLLLGGQRVVPHETLFQPSKQTLQVAA